jgi:hypothetical protein
MLIGTLLVRFDAYTVYRMFLPSVKSGLASDQTHLADAEGR